MTIAAMKEEGNAPKSPSEKQEPSTMSAPVMGGVTEGDDVLALVLCLEHPKRLAEQLHHAHAMLHCVEFELVVELGRNAEIERRKAIDLFNRCQRDYGGFRIRFQGFLSIGAFWHRGFSG